MANANWLTRAIKCSLLLLITGCHGQLNGPMQNDIESMTSSGELPSLPRPTGGHSGPIDYSGRRTVAGGDIRARGMLSPTDERRPGAGVSSKSTDVFEPSSEVVLITTDDRRHTTGAGLRPIDLKPGDVIGPTTRIVSRPIAGSSQAFGSTAGVNLRSIVDLGPFAGAGRGVRRRTPRDGDATEAPDTIMYHESGERSREESEILPADDEDAAFFVTLETNVSVSQGETAFLRCRLRKTHQQVTWVRVRDWHILTAGMQTYTADARFRVKHATDSPEWTLEMRFVQTEDEGAYLCQVPTSTGTIVHTFYVQVLHPQAVILAAEVAHVDVLTPVTLVCIIDNALNPPQFIYWYHNGSLLKEGQYQVGGSAKSAYVTMHTTLTSSRTMSMLTLTQLQYAHSGNYTCSAPNARSDSTFLFVTQRFEQATLDRSNSSGRSPAWSSRRDTLENLARIFATLAVLVGALNRSC